MKKHLLRTAACALILGALASCQSDDIVNPANMSQEELAQEIEKHFDFKSYKTLPLSLSVSPFESIKLYSVDPAQYPDVDPFFTTVANSEGHFNISLPFPGHLIGKTVWVKGRNGVMKATLTDKGLDIISKSRAIATKGVKEFCKGMMDITDHTLLPGHNNVVQVKSQMSEIDITPIDESTGVEVKVAMIDNGDEYDVRVYYYYYTGEDPKQTYGYKDFIEKFIQDDAQKFRLFPNDAYSNITLNDYWMHDNYNGNDGLDIGHEVQLKYYGENLDEEGIDKFPAGVKIGFALLNAEGSRGNQWLKLTSGGVYHVMYDNNNLATDESTWENASEGWKNDYAAAMAISDFAGKVSDFEAKPEKEGTKISNIIYTFEDATASGDWDMNDVKMLAIVAGDIKETIPEMAVANGIFKGYYCFEDLYPNQDGGDYDMNDVIVSYEYYYVLGNTMNPNESDNARVIYFDYVIKPIHDGATYINDFHLAYNHNSQIDKRASSTSKEIYKDHASKVADTESKFEGYGAAVFNSTSGKYVNVASESDDFAKGVIFASVSNIIGPTDMTQSGNLLLGRAGINPYIYCQTTGEEVHLSKFTYSGPNNGNGLHEGETIEQCLLRHYLTNYQEDGKYKYCPFAIDIPNCDENKFRPTPEATPIYQAYPRFVQWVESEGRDATDWYTDTPISDDIPDAE